MARDLRSQDYTLDQTAKLLGVSRRKLISWKIIKSEPWHEEALMLHRLNVSGRSIARRLNVSHNKVAYFLKGKPRNTLYDEE